MTRSLRMMRGGGFGFLKRILEIKNLCCFCKVLIIFTDGAQTQKRENLPDDERIKPEDNAQKLKDKNVAVFTVGAGTPDPVELIAMASDVNYVIVAELEKLGLAVNAITRELCKIEVTVNVLLLPYKGFY